VGAAVGGRTTYEAARNWGGKNPWGLPFFIVTHRPEEEPEGGESTFVSGVEAAVERAKEAAGGKHVHVMGTRRRDPAGARRGDRRRADDRRHRSSSAEASGSSTDSPGRSLEHPPRAPVPVRDVVGYRVKPASQRFGGSERA
jgi:hypothetical protein